VSGCARWIEMVADEAPLNVEQQLLLKDENLRSLDNSQLPNKIPPEIKPAKYSKQYGIICTG